MRRRELIRGGLRGGLVLGIAKTLHNTTLGYGHLGLGTNLREQDLDRVAREQFSLPTWWETTVNGVTIRFRSGTGMYLTTGGSWAPLEPGNVPPEINGLATGIASLVDDSFTFRFADPDTFFKTIRHGNTHAGLVDIIRGRRQQRDEPRVVTEFAGVEPTASSRLVHALVETFRSRTQYDLPRYIAGSIDDNVLPIRGDLRDPFRPTVTFEAILDAEDPVGLFCGEYVELSIRAVESVAAADQSPPLYGVYVRDRRHKHAFTGFGSAMLENGRAVLPMTFVDYTDTTRYGDYHLESVFGAGFDAYDTWHRADEIRW